VAGQTAVLGSRNSEQNVGPSTWSASAARISLVGSAIRATIEAHEHAQQVIIGEHVRPDQPERRGVAGRRRGVRATRRGHSQNADASPVVL
jgi:hypothetical protein